jgi:hypothetical protein
MIVNHPLYRTAQSSASGLTVAVDADCFPACRILAEDVDGVGLRVDDLTDPVTGFTEHVLSDGGDEDAALDAVTAGLQRRRRGAGLLPLGCRIRPHFWAALSPDSDGLSGIPYCQ